VSVRHLAPALGLATVGLVPFLHTGCVGCDEAPPPPEGGAPGDLSIYQAWNADMEILDPLLLDFIDEGSSYAAEGGDDCYRLDDLDACDAAAVCLTDVDPTGLPCITHAEVIEHPVSLLEEALMLVDWMEVFQSSYNSFETVWEEGREDYLSGESHYYERTYEARLPILTAEISIVTNLQFRRIDDWDGTGEPLVYTRGYYPEPAFTSSENITSNMLFSIGILIPWDDGETTLRIFSNCSDLTIGGYSTDDSWGLACSQAKSSWGDLNDWCEENE